MRQKGIGLIGFLVIIVLIILALSYFGIDIRGVVESPTTQTNFAYLKDLVADIWHNLAGIIPSF